MPTHLDGFNWRCWFGLHPWDKWSAMREAKRTIIYNPSISAEPVTRTFPVVYQVRECAKCGRLQHKDIK